MPAGSRLALIGSANLVVARKDIPQTDGSVDADYISRANRVYGYVGVKTLISALISASFMSVALHEPIDPQAFRDTPPLHLMRPEFDLAQIAESC